MRRRFGGMASGVAGNRTDMRANQTLTIARSLKRPKFLRTHRSLEDWINRSRTQSEFTRLRQDRRYAEVIRKARLAAE